MSSFNMKMRRTRKYNEDGSIIYNTMNSTGLVNKYRNHNPRFDTNHKKIGDSVKKCNCTIAGCGTQCCFNYILISDISQNTWNSSSKFNNGKNIMPGTKVKTNGNLVGIIEDFFFPYSNSCIPLADCDCSGSFPISVRLVIKSLSGSCVIDMSNVNVISFSPPSGGNYNILSNEVKIEHENYSVLGSSRRGKPYRAPIAGYRKTLECCDPTMMQMCTEYCLMRFIIVDNNGINSLNVTVGQDLYLLDGSFYGSVNSTSNSDIVIKIKLGDCNKKLKEFLRFINIQNIGTFLNSAGVRVQYVKYVEIKEIYKQCKTVTNDVYKDPSVKSCLIDGVCYDKRIRSGMQPKKQLTCNKDCNKKCERKYSFSYNEYNKNRAMNTYERSLEINRKWDSVNEKYESCPKEFYKSSGDACLNCDNKQIKPKFSKTVWKPNNKTFKKQGAVSSGSRLERLKLDTIRSANSKCEKGERCIVVDCEKIPKGKYFAGRPRFTGWMYNKNHRERVWGNRNISYIRNRPLPLGIPQLTNKGRSTRNMSGNNNWRPHTSGTIGVYQRTFPRQRSTAKNLRVVGYRDTCNTNCN